MALIAAVLLVWTGQVLTGPVVATAATECPDPIRTVLDTTPATADRTVALTFDDGPLPQNTADVLDVLASQGVKATFFVRGDQVAAHPELARRIVAEGHAIGNHTWSHPDLAELSEADRVAQIERGTAAIVDATDTTPCFFRGPFGAHHDPSIASLAWDRGMTVANWSIDTRDWETPPTSSATFQQQIIDRATSPASAHPIVLMHDGGGYRQNTVAALDEVISYYASRGYTFTDPAGRVFPSGEDGTYVVQPGDTLSAIASRYDGVSWQEIYAANRATIGPDPSLIEVGQRLIIPGAGSPFSDVSASDPFGPAILSLYEAGIVGGYSDGTFRNRASVNRDAMAAFMFRTVNPDGEAPACSEAAFVDVPASHPFCGEIAWLAESGVTTGWPDGTFRPSSAVTREAMAAFMYRLGTGEQEAPACEGAPFADVSTGHPFCGAIGWMAETGISTGWEDDTFRPGLAVERQAMAAFLRRFIDKGYVPGVA